MEVPRQRFAIGWVCFLIACLGVGVGHPVAAQALYPYSSISVPNDRNNWNLDAAPMQALENGWWVLNLPISGNLPFRFKFAANGSWTTNWGSYAGPYSLPIELAVLGSNSTISSLPNIEVAAPAGGFSGSYDIYFYDGGNYEFSPIVWMYPAYPSPPPAGPTLAERIPDQSAYEGIGFEYLIPGSVFNSSGGPSLDYSASLAEGGVLPAWLRFDPVQRKFSGTPPAGQMDFSIRVTATDGTQAVSTQFRIYVDPPLIISEFMADNVRTRFDQDGDASDWIEINNSANTPFDLAGYRLTDDPQHLKTWTFPSVSVPARGSTLVYASNKNRANPQTELHTSFSLSAKGEYLALLRPDGTEICEYTFGSQYPDISYGRQTDGVRGSLRLDPSGYFVTPTPGSPNDQVPAPHPVYGDHALARADLTLNPSDLSAMNANPWDETLRRGSLRWRQGGLDLTLADVGVRYRGNTSRLSPKKSWLISFNTFVSGGNLLGLEKLNLNAEPNDVSSLRSKLMNDFASAVGLPAAWENHVALFVNGQFEALLQNTQPIDDVFVERHFGSSRGNLYKCLYPADLSYRAGGDYQTVMGQAGNQVPRPAYELDYSNGGATGHADLAAFLNILHNTPADQFPAEIRKIFEVDDFLKRLAFDALCGNWDDYWLNQNNYYLWRSAATGQWSYLPYDMDNTFGIDFLGLDWATRDVLAWGRSGRPLAEKILAVPEWNRRYQFYLRQIMDRVFRGDITDPYWRRIRQVLAGPVPASTFTNAVEADRSRWASSLPLYTYANYTNSLTEAAGDYVKYGIQTFLDARRTSALAQLGPVQNVAPILQKSKVAPTLPAPGDTITLTIQVEDDGTSLPDVSLSYRFSGEVTQTISMRDDGLLGDQVAGDGIWTVVLPPMGGSGTLYYRIFATDLWGASTQEPWAGSAEASLPVGSRALDLRLTEIHYHPHEPRNVVLNEILVNPPGTDAPQEFVEIRGPNQTALTNLWVVAFNGDIENNPGKAIWVMPLSGVSLGSKGLLLVKAATGGFTAGSGTATATSTQLNSGGSGLPNGSVTFQLLESPVPLVLNTDYDGNNDGVLELPAGTKVMDSVAWRDGNGSDILYGGIVITPTSGTPDAVVRFGDRNDFSPSCWYGGDLSGSTNTSTSFSSSPVTSNYPAGGSLTPGVANTPARFSEADYDFLEFRNLGSAPLALGGFKISSAVDFTFPEYTVPAGGYVLVCENLAAFQSLYGTNLPVAGVWNGALSNSGETIVWHDAGSNVIGSAAYSDGGKWPARADGDGSSLEVVDPRGDLNDGMNWQASLAFAGSPGTESVPPPRIVINEVLAHTDWPLLDSIELLNLETVPVDLSGWWLSDTASVPTMFRIPNGTVIPAGGYLVFNESQLNPHRGNSFTGPWPNHFSLSAVDGDRLTLFQPSSLGSPGTFVDEVSFGGSLNGESFGRWPNGTGVMVPQKSRSLGSGNSGPRVGPLILSEIMYAPGNNDASLEFVEIYNPTPVGVSLVNWRIRGGVDYDFPDATELPSGRCVLVVSFSPTENPALASAFRAAYGLSASVSLYGPYRGLLDNAGEALRLERPDDPPAGQPTIIPRVWEDGVEYGVLSPWPACVGTGQSLTRKSANWNGLEPNSWKASTASPGTFSPPAVYLNAIDSVAREYPSLAARIEVVRELLDGADVTVAMDYSGSAAPGLDYILPGNPVTVPAASGMATLIFQPRSDTLCEGNESIKVEILPGSAYTLGTSNTAEITLEDHPLDQKRLQIFGHLALSQAASASDLADADGDGKNNLLEMALGQNPLQGDSAPALQIQRLGSSMNVRWQQPATDLGVQILPLKSDELGGATWSVISPSLVGEANGVQTWEVNLPMANLREFLRLQIQAR